MKNYVWKKMLAASAMLLIAVMLGACVPTPDVPPVISRAQGLPEGTAISAITDQEPKVLDVPARWSETMDRNEGKIQIQADLAIALEPVINTPVYEFAQTEFSAELLSGLCSYFSRGQKLYRALPMTKEELKVQYGKMEEKKGDFSSGSYYLAEKMRRLEQLMEEAPEAKPEKTYVQPSFGKMEQVGNERLYIDMRSDYLFDSEKETSFTAGVETKETVEPVIRATSYEKDAGTSSCFSYSRGVMIDEDELFMDQNAGMALHPTGNKDEESYFSKIEKALDTMETIEEAQAIKEAEKILQDLGLSGYGMTSCCRALCNPKSDSWAGLDESLDQAEVGYSMTFYRKAGELPAYNQYVGFAASDLPETVYAPPFYSEYIQIVITKSGLQKFEWDNMAEMTKVIAENTKLLPFEEIKKRLADHLLYEAVASDEANGLDGYTVTHRYTVSGVELRAAYINAYNQPERAWLVPVWVFDLNSYMMVDGQKEQNRGNETYMINALDGGYVAMAQ